MLWVAVVLCARVFWVRIGTKRGVVHRTGLPLSRRHVQPARDDLKHTHCWAIAWAIMGYWLVLQYETRTVQL